MGEGTYRNKPIKCIRAYYVTIVCQQQTLDQIQESDVGDITNIINSQNKKKVTLNK